MDINNYFDHIFVLNLEKRLDRKERMIYRLNKAGITNYEFITAIDGSIEPYLSICNYKLKYNGFFESPGAMGILLTVYKVLMYSKAKKYKKILILEDDAIFHKDFKDNFNKKILNIPDWKLLYLGTSMDSGRLNKCLPKNNNINFITSIGTITGSFGIGIDSSIFDELIISIKNTNKAWDIGPLRDINIKYHEKVIILYPYLIICDTIDSNLRESISLKNTAHRCNWNINNFDY